MMNGLDDHYVNLTVEYHIFGTTLGGQRIWTLFDGDQS